VTARDRFAAEIVGDANDYLAGAITAEEFAGSVWYGAGTLALSFADDDAAPCSKSGFNLLTGATSLMRSS
jgi:hypothetical protein